MAPCTLKETDEFGTSITCVILVNLKSFVNIDLKKRYNSVENRCLCGFVNMFTSLCIMTNLYVLLTVLWTLIHAQLNLVQTMESVSNLLVEALDAPAPQAGLENAVICVSCVSFYARTSRWQERGLAHKMTFSGLLLLLISILC